MPKPLAKRNFSIAAVCAAAVLLQDISQSANTRTITNDAENVVAQLGESQYRGKRIFYIDTMNTISELVHVNNVFTGYAPSSRKELEMFFDPEELSHYKVANA